MRVRLVPVGEIFRRMPFVVRDLARETGKRVRLELQGQGTEIDKFLIERMMDPVLHLVRNAVSHGIETAGGAHRRRQEPGGHDHPQRRHRRRRRPDRDRRRWPRRRRGGGGRARAGGRAPGAARARWTRAICSTLLCAPGFSTRDESDRASGRGVGMGVVQAAVEELSGSLSLETTPGAGTRFTLELPVTLAITDALIATVGGRDVRRAAGRDP